MEPQKTEQRKGKQGWISSQGTETLRALIEAKKLKLVMVATDKPEKDWPTAEAAYALAKKSIPALEFVRVKNLPHEETLTAIANADIFMLTSKAEGGNSLALMEAMSMGKACVVSDVGGFKDVIVNNENGLLIPVGHPEKFAGAILVLCLSDGLRMQLGEAAKETAKKFSWRNTALQYETLFRSL